MPGLEEILTKGKPTFDELHRYTGPLQPSTQKTTPLIRKNSASFKTSAAAAWPPQLCKAFAECIFKQDARTTNMAPEDGMGGSSGSGGKAKRGTGGGRRKLTKQDIGYLEKGDTGNRVYIGRGFGGGGKEVPRSKWANPFKVGEHGDRKAVLEKYRRHLDIMGLARQVGSLEGKMLLCHCPIHSPCHGDILLKEIARQRGEKGEEQDGKKGEEDRRRPRGHAREASAGGGDRSRATDKGHPLRRGRSRSDAATQQSCLRCP
jgi:hypothetical protein